MTRVLDYIEIETPAWLVTSPMGPDVTWRFTKPTEGTPKSIEAFPSVRSISFTPATISLGENLGTRATLSVTFSDHRHIFNGEPFDQGTFFGKWRGRYGQRLRSRPVRWIRHVLDDEGSIASTETWHFIVEAVDGPTPDGVYTVTAQDVLKMADDERSLAPRPSRGSLIGTLGAGSPLPTSATLTPTGIGDIDYPASGFVNIGGKEICAFTRAGDVLTLTRNTTVPGTTFETEIVEHAAGSRVQLCLDYIADDPADIIADLFETYAGVDPSYIDQSDWQEETDNYLQTLYTTIITEPTGVNKLVTELVQQVGLAIWWDAIGQTLRLQVLRPIPTTAATFDESKFLARSLRTQDQPAKRISEVLVYHGLREPLKPIDQDDNYRSILFVPDPEAAVEYGGAVTRTIKSRWIPFGAQQVASRLSYNLLGRYRDPPRQLNFDTWRFSEDVPELGGGYQFGWTQNQDQDGLQVLAPIQVTRLVPAPEKYSVQAEESLWTFYDEAPGGGLQNRIITISSNINNVNLRTLHDNIYPELTADDLVASPPVTVTFIVSDNVIVGSTDNANPAMEVGDWLVGFTPLLQLNGRIQGKGGNGGSFGGGPAEAEAGGPALYTRHDIDIEYGADAEIFGGAGGGAITVVLIEGDLKFSGGGGGAGQLPGSGGNATEDDSVPGNPGTTEAGGTPGGGDPGEAGANGFALGGAAGTAIDGVSFVNVVSGSADVRGSTIN